MTVSRSATRYKHDYGRLQGPKHMLSFMFMDRMHEPVGQQYDVIQPYT